MKLGLLTSKSLVDVAAPDRLLTVDELIAASGCKPQPVTATIKAPIELPVGVIDTTGDIWTAIRDAELVRR